MSLYILDTDTLQLLQDEHPRVIARIQAVPLEDRAISIISVEEQLSGWYAQLRQAKQPERLAWAYRRLAATVRFLSRVQIVDFEEAAIRRYTQLKKASSSSAPMTSALPQRCWNTVRFSSLATSAISARFPVCKSRIGRHEPPPTLHRRKTKLNSQPTRGAALKLEETSFAWFTFTRGLRMLGLTPLQSARPSDGRRS